MPLIRFASNLLLVLINTLFCALVLFAFALLRLIPLPFLQAFGRKWAVAMAELWANNNRRIFNFILPTRWQVDLPEVHYQQSYLTISNHQSWVDIVVLQSLFNGKIPFYRFFLKYELIFVPILGLCWWALDYPFMRRYTKEQIKKNPALKHRDKEEALRQMQKFKDSAVSIMVFVEGTRFTQDKHLRQESPYQNLLKPKAAGAAYALNSLSEQLDTALDVTIVYPHGVPTFVEFLSGRCAEIRVQARTLPIARELRVGEYESDKAYRVQFQNWLNEIWHNKDHTINALKNPVPPTNKDT